MFEIPGSSVIAVHIMEDYVLGKVPRPNYIKKPSGVTDIPADEEEHIKATAIVQ